MRTNKKSVKTLFSGWGSYWTSMAGSLFEKYQLLSTVTFIYIFSVCKTNVSPYIIVNTDIKIMKISSQIFYVIEVRMGSPVGDYGTGKNETD